MDYSTHLRNFWFPNLVTFWWVLLSLPALYFFQTVIHEGSHAMAAFVVTGHLPKLAPFPHQAKGDGFLNGVTLPLHDGSTEVTVVERTKCNSEERESNTRLAGFPATPQFVDLVLIAIFSAIFLLTKNDNPTTRFLLRLWYLGAMLDFCYNTIRGLIGGCREDRDWGLFMISINANSATFAPLTLLLWVVFIASHFMWVKKSAWSEPVRFLGFWEYRWVAFVLGCLSLIAVLLSVFISDREVVKKSFEFIVPFVIQIAALIFYWTYFVLSFSKDKDKDLLIA